jgi:hypothetical protein
MSQRSSAAKIMATTSKTEFMDYYFTRAERNSPPRLKQRKRSKTERALSWGTEVAEKMRFDAEAWDSWGAAVLRPYLQRLPG